MAILIISAVFPPEPLVSAKLSLDLSLALSQSEDITVLSPKPSRPDGFKFTNSISEFNFNHIILKSFTCARFNLWGRLRETYSFGKNCSKYISEHHSTINLIYSNTWPLIAQYFSVYIAKKYNIPIIVHVQDIYPESLSNKFPLIRLLVNFILLPIDLYNLKNATKVIAISTNMKKYLLKTRKIDKNKITVIHNWQDEEQFSSKISIVTEGNKENYVFTFMYLGNIGPVAGIDFLIEGFAKAKLYNCKLIIAGSGSMKENMEKLALKYADSRIEFISVPEGKVHEIQALSDIMLLPMKKGAASSSIPSKLSAYMFSKKPIIACVENDSDTANAIIKSNSGWVLPPENVKLLAECMQNVSKISMNELILKGNQGYQYAIKNFSKRNNLKLLLNLINLTKK